MRLLKYIKRKEIQSKVIDFTELDAECLLNNCDKVVEVEDQTEADSEDDEAVLHQLVNSYTYQDFHSLLGSYFEQEYVQGFGARKCGAYMYRPSDPKVEALSKSVDAQCLQLQKGLGKVIKAITEGRFRQFKPHFLEHFKKIRQSIYDTRQRAIKSLIRSSIAPELKLQNYGE